MSKKIVNKELMNKKLVIFYGRRWNELRNSERRIPIPTPALYFRVMQEQQNEDAFA